MRKEKPKRNANNVIDEALRIFQEELEDEYGDFVMIPADEMAFEFALTLV